jgi:hypothetical protein
VARASRFDLWITGACRVLAAATGLLEDVAGLLRQFEHVVGWLVLLWGTVGLLAHPSLAVGHLAISGAGALAVVQGLVHPGRRKKNSPAVSREVHQPGSSGDASGAIGKSTPTTSGGESHHPGDGLVPPGRGRRSLKAAYVASIVRRRYVP